MKFGFVPWRWIVCIVAVILAGLIPLVPVVAAQTVSTGSIVGQVTDESQAVIPGVTVIVTSPALQVPQRTAVTDERGEYRFTQLPIGTYTVEYSLTGFTTVRREEIRLTAGFTARLDITMTVGGVEETVTVTGESPVVDVASTANTTQLTSETIELIPTTRNGYNALLMQAPGARSAIDSPGPNSGVTFSAFGQRRQSYQALDGVVTVNPKTDTQSGNYVDYSIMEEAVVETLGHDAAIPNRGIAINAIVKSGSNTLHGSGFMSYSSQSLSSDNITDELREQGVSEGDSLDLRDDYSGEVGGKIIQDKLWFYVGGRFRRDQTNILGCYVTPAYEVPEGTTYDERIALAFPGEGEQCLGRERAYFLTGKGTYQSSPNHRFTGMFQNNVRRDVETFSRTVAYERRRFQKGFNPVYKVEWTGLFGDSMTASAMVGGWINHSGSFAEMGVLFGPEESILADGVKNPARDRRTGLRWGNGENTGERNREDRFNVRADWSIYKPDWAGGNHEIRIGVDHFQANANRNRVLNDQNVGNNTGEARHGISIAEVQFSNGRPDRVSIQNIPVEPLGPLTYFAGYVTDTWTIGRKLTLNLGLRYAWDSGTVPEQCREASPAPFDVVNPATCFAEPDPQFSVYNSLAPRTRFSYDVNGDGKTVVKGGWGRYYQFRYSDELHTVNQNVINTTNYRWRDLNGNLEWDEGESNLDLNGPDFISRSQRGQGGALAGGVVNPDQKEPYTDEYMVQFERELIPDLAFRATGAYSRALRQTRLENRLRPPEVYTIPVTGQDPGPDGVLGTGDDGGPLTYYEYPEELAGEAFQEAWVVNDDKANQTYKTIELALAKRLSNRWQMRGAWTYTSRNEPLVWNVGGGTTYGANTRDPNAEINTSDDNPEWQVRLTGSYLFPFYLTASANLDYRSGDVWARTYELEGGNTIPSYELNVEPIGSQRNDSITRLDLRFEQRFPFAGSQSFSVRANIYNALNAGTILSKESESGPTFGYADSILLPRILDIAFIYRF